MSNPSANAERFRLLHQGPQLLILANAWDAASARMIEADGARAVATTSAGLAWCCGFPDGNALAPDNLLHAVENIIRVIRVPLTVDVEGGYGSTPEAVAERVASVIRAGAAGINIEDGAEPPQVLADRIRAVRAVASKLGVDLFINARTDVLLRGLASGSHAIDEVVKRADGYRAAGADGVFVPAVVDRSAIAELVSQIPIPLNVMAVPGLPGARELADLGVRRLSAGAAIAQSAFGHARTLARSLLTDGSSEPLFAGDTADYADMNRLMSGRAPE
jgi:2-methylisocitrate lyase-like PEP mutase family enzyme